MQAVGKVIEGSSYLQQGKYNQAIAERNALATENDAAAQVEVSREQLRKAMGDQIVQQGASGMEIGTGSAVDQLMDSQVNGMLDAMTIRRQGRTQGEAYRQQGQLARMQSQTQATASYFGAAKEIFEKKASYAGGAG